MITGADDLHTLQLIKEEVTEILTHSNFSLSKWHSNCLNLSLTDAGIKEVRIDDDSTSTLGISWYTSDDTFHFEFRPLKSYSHNTKRTILSLTSTLFDPMGLISPLIIKSKILLQTLWILKCDWDESVPQEIDTAWTNILADYHNLPQLKISRFIRLTNLIDLQVHGFGDASIKAYGCCLYFRCIDSFGNIVTNLVASKSRVAPLKTRSLPRLELCASHLLAIFWNQLKNHFNYSISKIHFWSDSQIALHWIRTHSSTLSTFVVDGVELIRVGGRLLNSDLPEDMKFPFLLPKSDPFVKVMINHFHQSNYHAGPRALVSLIQQQFWIINCRSLARQVVYSCIHCTKYKPKLLTQVMGNLPKDRVSGSRPFQVVGVDFAGPIATYLRIRGKTPYKSYIAVFVCFATKAVHLETVSDLSSDAFIAALKRFIGRRGLPSKIYCDNATNFIGAESKLKEFHKQFHLEETKSKIESFSGSKHIQFIFIPPRAPHFGGLWEAAVKSKGHLFRTLPNARLTFEELSTALVEIEAVMNSRKISPASTDPNDLQALTPGHFLIGCPLLSLPERKNFDPDRRWHKEYLAQLQHRYKWQTPQQDLKVNDMVNIHEDNVPPLKWTIGRVTNIVSGDDGYARVADVRTPTNLLRRPVAKLAKLPID
ncbi:uncharacterized protein LOC142235637 [Haematobia irritans]|uniref:uncharacterized protein LOC142235637 n=1 Tax=Haematobia irritans TaxID=7368 RepID=UPI003F509632